MSVRAKGVDNFLETHNTRNRIYCHLARKYIFATAFKPVFNKILHLVIWFSPPYVLGKHNLLMLLCINNMLQTFHTFPYYSLLAFLE